MTVEKLSPVDLWDVVGGLVSRFDVDRDVFVESVKSSKNDGEGWEKLQFKNQYWAIEHVYSYMFDSGDVTVHGCEGTVELSLSDKSIYLELTYDFGVPNCLTGPYLRRWDIQPFWGVPQQKPDYQQFAVNGRRTRWSKASEMACNHSTPSDVLGRMTRYKDPVVAALAVHNPNCPDWVKVEYELAGRINELENT